MKMTLEHSIDAIKAYYVQRLELMSHIDTNELMWLRSWIWNAKDITQIEADLKWHFPRLAMHPSYKTDTERDTHAQEATYINGKRRTDCSAAELKATFAAWAANNQPQGTLL